MRITLLVTERMVFAMYGHPLFCDHAGGEPQPKSHEMTQQGMKDQAAMSLSAMQKHRDAHNGDVGHDNPRGQYRMIVVDDVKVHVCDPGAVS
jgi:hypothetical protein